MKNYTQINTRNDLKLTHEPLLPLVINKINFPITENNIFKVDFNKTINDIFNTATGLVFGTKIPQKKIAGCLNASGNSVFKIGVTQRFICKELVYPGSEEDIQEISDRWVYVFHKDEVKNVYYINENQEWSIYSYSKENKHIFIPTASYIELGISSKSDYQFFLSPIQLNEDSISYIVKNKSELNTLITPSTKKQDNEVLLINLFDWVQSALYTNYHIAVENKKTFERDEVKVQQLYVANFLKNTRGKKVMQTVIGKHTTHSYQSTPDDKMGIDNELYDGEPENYIKSYENEKLFLAEDIEAASGFICQLLESHDFAAIELSYHFKEPKKLYKGEGSNATDLMDIWAELSVMIGESPLARQLFRRLLKDPSRFIAKILNDKNLIDTKSTFGEYESLFIASLQLYILHSSPLLISLNYETELEYIYFNAFNIDEAQKLSGSTATPLPPEEVVKIIFDKKERFMDIFDKLAKTGKSGVKHRRRTQAKVLNPVLDIDSVLKKIDKVIKGTIKKKKTLNFSSRRVKNPFFTKLQLDSTVRLLRERQANLKITKLKELGSPSSVLADGVAGTIFEVIAIAKLMKEAVKENEKDDPNWALLGLKTMSQTTTTSLQVTNVMKLVAEGNLKRSIQLMEANTLLDFDKNFKEMTKANAAIAAKESVVKVLGTAAGVFGILLSTYDTYDSASNKHDYGQALGHGISIIGGSMSMAAFFVSSTLAGPIGWAGLVMTIGGSVIAQFLSANAYEEFAKCSFLGKSHNSSEEGVISHNWHTHVFTKKDGVDEQKRAERMTFALKQLLAAYNIKLKSNRNGSKVNVRIATGILEGNSFFDFWLTQIDYKMGELPLPGNRTRDIATDHKTIFEDSKVRIGIRENEIYCDNSSKANIEGLYFIDAQEQKTKEITNVSDIRAIEFSINLQASQELTELKMKCLLSLNGENGHLSMQELSPEKESVLTVPARVEVRDKKNDKKVLSNKIAKLLVRVKPNEESEASSLTDDDDQIEVEK